MYVCNGDEAMHAIHVPVGLGACRHWYLGHHVFTDKKAFL